MVTPKGIKTQQSRPRHELPKQLPLDFLKKVTNDFSAVKKIGGGPFGEVYKVLMPDDGRVIAVKKLQENAPMPPGKTLHNEVQNIMALKHENIVQLVGFCSESQKKLVQSNGRYIIADITESLLCYEYLPKGSLRQNLFAEPGIDWATRFKIIKGICQGLLFLHKLDIPIIHMDLKPEKILLDANMVPKIADFGLSRVFGIKNTRLHTQTVVGSYGYMAPEYLHSGEISARSDIYSLGILILEITTEEQNFREENDPSGRKFIAKVHNEWTKEHIASKYEYLDTEGRHQVNTCIEIGLNCVKIRQCKRPTIGHIVERLDGQRTSKMANEVPRSSPGSKKRYIKSKM